MSVDELGHGGDLGYAFVVITVRTLKTDLAPHPSYMSWVEGYPSTTAYDDDRDCSIAQAESMMLDHLMDVIKSTIPVEQRRFTVKRFKFVCCPDGQTVPVLLDEGSKPVVEVDEVKEITQAQDGTPYGFVRVRGQNLEIKVSAKGRGVDEYAGHYTHIEAMVESHDCFIFASINTEDNRFGFFSKDNGGGASHGRTSGMELDLHAPLKAAILKFRREMFYAGW